MTFHICIPYWIFYGLWFVGAGKENWLDVRWITRDWRGNAQTWFNCVIGILALNSICPLPTWMPFLFEAVVRRVTHFRIRSKCLKFWLLMEASLQEISLISLQASTAIPWCSCSWCWTAVCLVHWWLIIHTIVYWYVGVRVSNALQTTEIVRRL